MNKGLVVLVDESDNEIGVIGKLEAHEKGLLHRAFSIFIFNDKNELLLQKRASSKYHSAGLWSNTCCSHPAPGESNIDAANRRLFEEMGLSTLLFHKHSFVYKTKFDNNLTEHEFDHVYFGYSNAEPILDLNEAETFKWISIDKLNDLIRMHPAEFTSWFKIIMSELFQ